MSRQKTMSDTAVLSAAGRVFGRIGPSRFTLADVAREAGLAPATLSQRFGSKHALLVAFAKHAAHTARRPFEQAKSQGTRPLDTLRTALALTSHASRDRQELRHSLAFLLEDLADAELRAHAARHARWTEVSIRELLDDAVADGQLKTKDTARLARALQAGWNGALIQWAIRGRGALGTWIGAVIDTLLEPHLVGPPPARRGD